MKKIRLSKRLAAVAGLIDVGERVTDVGTDHGLVPAWLLTEGVSPHVTATDLRREPLQKAVRLCGELGLSARADFLLTDGLRGVRPESTDAVIIAGMGGETIAAIVEAAPWLREKKLVLQPMTKQAELTARLYALGFHVQRQLLAEDEGEVYSVLLCRYGAEPAPTGLGLYVSARLSDGEGLLGKYLDRLIARSRRAVRGLESAEAPDTLRLASERALLRSALQMKEERAVTKVSDICDFMEKLAPKRLKLDFDNVGLLVGRRDAEVRSVTVALDITSEVIAEAEARGSQLIVSHHPLFFSLKSVTDETVEGRKIIALLSSGISAICMHTNLDAVWGGVNDALAAAVGLTGELGILEPGGVDDSGRAVGIGRIGTLSAPLPLTDFALTAKAALAAPGLRYYDAGRPAHRVAVGGGSCGDCMALAIAAGCDTLLTSDVKYNYFLDAKELGLNLIDLGHFCTENVVCAPVRGALAAAFPDVEVCVSKRHGPTAKFL